MKSRPKSHRALMLAVQYVDASMVEGGLNARECLILNCLATNARSASGEGSRPGNTNLLAASKLKSSSAMRRYFPMLEGKGLIERTEVGDGRKKASVYSICWKHPAYPDKAPNDGELLTEKLAESESACFDENLPNPNGKLAESESETCRSEAGNLPNSGRKLAEYDSAHNNPPAEEQQTPIQPPAPQSGAADGGRRVLSGPAMLREFKRRLPLLTWPDGTPFGDLFEGAPMPSAIKKRTEVALVKFGLDVMLDTVRRWVVKRDMPVQGLRQKWLYFGDECQPHLEAALAAARGNSAEGKASQAANEEARQEYQERYIDQMNLLVWNREPVFWPRDCTAEESALVARTQAVDEKVDKPVFSSEELRQLRMLSARGEAEHKAAVEKLYEARDTGDVQMVSLIAAELKGACHPARTQWLEQQIEIAAQRRP